MRLKRKARNWEFPLSFDEVNESPLAGSFDHATAALLDHALGEFPFARRTGDGRRAWRIAAPARGTIDAWVTHDGSLFVDGDTSLGLVYGVLVHLQKVCSDLALEDRITGLLHDLPSLRHLVDWETERRRQQQMAAVA